MILTGFIDHGMGDGGLLLGIHSLLLSLHLGHRQLLGT